MSKLPQTVRPAAPATATASADVEPPSNDNASPPLLPRRGSRLPAGGGEARGRQPLRRGARRLPSGRRWAVDFVATPGESRPARSRRGCGLSSRARAPGSSGAPRRARGSGPLPGRVPVRHPRRAHAERFQADHRQAQRGRRGRRRRRPLPRPRGRARAAPLLRAVPLATAAAGARLRLLLPAPARLAFPLGVPASGRRGRCRRSAPTGGGRYSPADMRTYAEHPLRPPGRRPHAGDGADGDRQGAARPGRSGSRRYVPVDPNQPLPRRRLPGRVPPAQPLGDVAVADRGGGSSATTSGGVHRRRAGAARAPRVRPLGDAVPR